MKNAKSVGWVERDEAALATWPQEDSYRVPLSLKAQAATGRGQYIGVTLERGATWRGLKLLGRNAAATEFVYDSWTHLRDVDDALREAMLRVASAYCPSIKWIEGSRSANLYWHEREGYYCVEAVDDSLYADND